MRDACSRGFDAWKDKHKGKSEEKEDNLKTQWERHYLRSYFNFAFVCQVSIWSCFFFSWIYINFHNIFISNLNVYGDNHLSFGAVLWFRSFKINFYEQSKTSSHNLKISTSTYISIDNYFFWICYRNIFIKIFFRRFLLSHQLLNRTLNTANPPRDWHRLVS